ncbi:MAG: STAS domain-containing protein [Spirochaetota bacterium]|nr:STAS domain-containing protein [Spirochaetota bacterium]
MTKIEGDIIIVYLNGRLDIHLSVDVENRLQSIIKEEPEYHILIDLSDVEYMSSSGIRLLVSILRTVESNDRKLKLSNMNESVKKIFEIVELTSMFDIYNSEEEALKSFSNSIN